MTDDWEVTEEEEADVICGGSDDFWDPIVYLYLTARHSLVEARLLFATLFRARVSAKSFDAELRELVDAAVYNRKETVEVPIKLALALRLRSTGTKRRGQRGKSPGAYHRTFMMFKHVDRRWPEIKNKTRRAAREAAAREALEEWDSDGQFTGIKSADHLLRLMQPAERKKALGPMYANTYEALHG